LEKKGLPSKIKVKGEGENVKNSPQKCLKVLIDPKEKASPRERGIWEKSEKKTLLLLKGKEKKGRNAAETGSTKLGNMEG